MRTFEDIRAEVAPSQAELIDSLIAKGMNYSGTGMKDGVRCIEVKSEGNEIVIHPSGKVELFTEFLDPSNSRDTGYHVWTITATASPADIAATVADITSITGDN